ncbi:helix-turn-helix domain-containing protein [Paenibacillus sp. LMG 31461]|uniref:Helix-turn-helix domain-containing protein n=1 Tax=Paenibacillus plantarum TaxID=2654975 RepID=A0ABX1X8C1_9BACL|nr:helix-turn-helix domain-containing protein [Paenibacillus plantarum]NOU64569.1 helix-turn-helix domain-containing protein [Paenibacillus plantarum]
MSMTKASKEKIIAKTFFIKLLLIYLGTAVMSVLVLAIILYYWFGNKSTEDILAMNRLILNSVHAKGNSAISNANQIAYQIFKQSEFQGLMEDEKPGAADLLNTSKFIDTILLTNPAVASIYIIKNKQIVMEKTGRGVAEKESTIIELVESIKNLTPVVRSVPYTTGKIANVISILFKDEEIGSVLVTLDSDRLKQEVFNHNVADTSVAAIFDANGQILLSSNEEISSTKLYHKAYEQLSKNHQLSGSGSRIMQDEQHLIANYIFFENPDWTVLSLIRDNDIIREQSKAMKTIIAVISVIFVMLLFISIVVSKRYYLPMMLIFSQIVRSARKTGVSESMEAVNLKVIVNATKSLFERMNVLEHQEEMSIFTMQSRYIHTLLQQSNEMDEQEIREHLLDLRVVNSTQDAYIILVIRINGLVEFREHNTKMSSSLKLNSLGNLTLEMLGYDTNSTYVIVDEEQLVFLLQVDAHDRRFDPVAFESVLLQLRETSQNLWNLAFTAGVSEVEEQYNRIASRYKQACEVTNYRLYYGRDPVLYTSAVLIESENINESIRKTEKQLIKDIKQLATFEYEQHVNEYLALLCALPYRTAVKLNAQTIHSLLCILEDAIFLQAVKPEYDYQLIYNRVLTMETLSELREWYAEVYESVSRELIQINSSGTSDIVRKIIELTEQNYANSGISANGLADELNITPQYFSRIVKEAMGMSFPDYINNLRLNKARELLISHPEMGVKQIYESIGYNNAAYFTTLFKKTYGVTPTKYRKTVN